LVAIPLTHQVSLSEAAAAVVLLPMELVVLVILVALVVLAYHLQ
jgi:hypothetical protein